MPLSGELWMHVKWAKTANHIIDKPITRSLKHMAGWGKGMKSYILHLLKHVMQLRQFMHLMERHLCMVSFLFSMPFNFTAWLLSSRNQFRIGYRSRADWRNIGRLSCFPASNGMSWVLDEMRGCQLLLIQSYLLGQHLDNMRHGGSLPGYRLCAEKGNFDVS